MLILLTVSIHSIPYFIVKIAKRGLKIRRICSIMQAQEEIRLFLLSEYSEQK